MFPGDQVKSELLMRQANIAAYRAQECGASSIVFFSEGMQIAAARQIELEQVIRNGLAKEKILTRYQPIADAETGQIVAVEALMRMADHGGRLLSPTEFIPVAEKSGLIEQLGQLQLLRACQHFMLWQQLGLPELRLSVNLSPRQLQGNGLIALVDSVVAATKFSPSNLEFEITENLMLGDTDQVRALLSEIRKYGVKFALDDFGTGFNSMAYLRRGDLSRLKIDMSFVRDLGVKSNAQAITSSIISMAHNLGLKVVAEGVETAEQLDILQQQGCDELQGFLFCKPLNMEDFLAFFEANNGSVFAARKQNDAKAAPSQTQPSAAQT
jgi:EAL domain-containing protein (putative c-di-GMP-specific phosphodiesterase class I)